MTAIGIVAAGLTGLLAGAFANWAADVLPDRGGDKTATGATTPVQARGLRAALHYLTLPWYPFRGGVCPHCGEGRPVRAPLLEAATIVAFVVVWLPALRTFGVISDP